MKEEEAKVVEKEERREWFTLIDGFAFLAEGSRCGWSRPKTVLGRRDANPEFYSGGGAVFAVESRDITRMKRNTGKENERERERAADLGGL